MQDYPGGWVVAGISAGLSLTLTRTYLITADNVAEPDETIIFVLPTLRVTGTSDTYTTTSTDITITIRANDANNRPILTPTFHVTADNADTAEGETVVFTVTLAGSAPTGAATVDWAVSGAGITAGDYTVSGADTDGTLSFTSLSSQTLTFAIRDDEDVEDAEMLTVTLSNPSSGAVIGTASATTTIAESDQPHAHSFVFTSPAASIVEGTATATTYTVTRTGPDITGSITVTWAYAASTPAPVAADFHNDTLPAGGTLEFTGMETSETFTVRTKEDTLNEAGERFTLTLSIASAHETAANAEGGAGVPAAHTVTITDDDPVLITIARANSCAATVAENVGNCGIGIAIGGGTRATGVSLVVPFTVGGTGVTAADYDITAPAGIATTATGGSVTVAQSASSATITLAITDDNLNEATETLTVTGTAAGATGLRLTGTAGTFGAVEYASTSVDSASVMVTDNDAITVSIAAPSPATVEEGRVAAFAVSFAGATDGSAGPIDVPYTVAFTATSTGMFTDMTPGGGTLTIPAGQTEGTIRVRIDFSQTLDDDSPDETLRVTLGTIAPGTGAGSATGSGMADVTVEWQTAAHTISIADATVTEGAAEITVTRTGPALTTPATITWTVMAGTATAADFSGGALPSGTVTFAGSSMSETITVPIADDALSEAAENFTIALSADDATLASNMQIALGAAATITITDNDAISAASMTLRGPATVNEERSEQYTVDLGAEVTGSAVTVAIADSLAPSGLTASEHYSLSTMSITIAIGQRSGTFTVTATDGGGDETPDRELTLTLTATGGANTAAMAAITRAIAITEDDPVARAARLEAPLASAGKGVGQLAAAAVAGRLAAAVSGAAGASSLTIAGRDMSAGAEVLAAQFLAGGYATGARDLSADELLRQSGFNLAGGDGGRGFNFWGGGDFVSAEGDHDGVDYDGDTSAFTLGIDTGWKDGLVGVAVSRSDGDVDFTSAGEDYTLETEVTSMHPYLTRRLGRSQLWFTAGHGSGDAEIKEPNDVVIKTDLTVTTAAFGITHARGDLFTAGLSALYSRAKLDAVTTGRRLPATAADSLRIKADAETGWSHGAWRPFMSFALRHDSGDGDTGGAFDLGGGVEYQTPTVLVRLAGSGHIQGQGADEQRATLTVRKSTGNFDLGLNLATDGDGVDTGRLLTGEWRF